MLSAAPAFSAHYIERPIAIERRDFDGSNILDSGKAAPEGDGQDQPAHRRLQIKADKRYLARDRTRMRNQFVFARAMQSRERQKHDGVAKIASDPRLSQGLLGTAAQARDHDRLLALPFLGAAPRELQHRLVKASLANGDWGGVDPHG